MNATEAMKALEAAGTAQNRKLYARHGATGAMFGVSYATLGVLKKTIGTDTDLAIELFDTGYHDARVLATMIADPAEITAKRLRAWAKACGDYGMAGAVGLVAAKSPAGHGLALEWIRSRKEFVATTGWNTVAALTEAPEAEDLWFEPLLDAIDRDIHAAANRVRYAMNSALIAIGCRKGLTTRALAVAKRIGAVEVDHGETGCKTPDAAAYIAKTLGYRKKKAAVKKSTRAGR